MQVGGAHAGPATLTGMSGNDCREPWEGRRKRLECFLSLSSHLHKMKICCLSTFPTGKYFTLNFILFMYIFSLFKFSILFDFCSIQLHSILFFKSMLAPPLGHGWSLHPEVEVNPSFSLPDRSCQSKHPFHPICAQYNDKRHSDLH